MLLVFSTLRVYAVSRRRVFLTVTVLLLGFIPVGANAVSPTSLCSGHRDSRGAVLLQHDHHVSSPRFGLRIDLRSADDYTPVPQSNVRPIPTISQLSSCFRYRCKPSATTLSGNSYQHAYYTVLLLSRIPLIILDLIVIITLWTVLPHVRTSSRRSLSEIVLKDG